MFGIGGDNLGSELVKEGLRFFVGLHHPGDAGRVGRAFISANALRGRKGAIPANEWIMDSGAFTTIAKYGGYPDDVEEYACVIRRFAGCGTLLAAVAQDYMCEPMMLERTGLTVGDHQRLTIERYDGLLGCDVGGVYIMPVLQGYDPGDYVAHIRQYGGRLALGSWVGVGSVCKRNRSWISIRDVLQAIKAERPDLRLHGFGVKTTSLAYAAVRDLLWSADSMAWSYAARMQGRNGNSWREAERFAAKIDRQAPQLELW